MKTEQFEVVGITETCTQEIKIKWIITNFYAEGYHAVSSPEFEVKFCSIRTMWVIELRGNPLRGAIHLVRGDNLKIVVDGDITLLDFYADDNVLRLSISLKFSLENPCDKLISKPPIYDDLAKLRRDGKFSDLTISVHGTEFNVHKNILAARSPVFSAMFEHGMKEENSCKVEIEDIKLEVFEEFLDFIYTGNANVDSYAGELLAAADKYDVKDLRAFCEDALVKDLSEENCFKTLNLGDLHAVDNLKKEALNFIASIDCIEDKNGLAEITNLSLLKEVIEALVSQKI